MAWLPGFAGKCRVNGAIYAFGRIQVSARTDNQRTTNSEGLGGPTAAPGFHTSVAGNVVMVATVSQPSIDPVYNPFAAPLLIAEGTVISLQIYLNGVGSVSWFAPSFRIIECSQDFDANGLMPVSFSGESVGVFERPSS